MRPISDASWMRSCRRLTVKPLVGPSIEVNGKLRVADVDSAMPLAVFLRDVLNLRGTKIGCGNGECGACTVLMDGRAVCACSMPLGRARGRQIRTIESLGNPKALHPLQAILVEKGAFQCGFCTPGMVMSMFSRLQEGRAEPMAMLDSTAKPFCFVSQSRALHTDRTGRLRP